MPTTPLPTVPSALLSPTRPHDACGLGFVARPDNRASHEIVEQGLTLLANLNHRGTVNADGKSGDGAGILVQIPHVFFRHEAKKLGITLPEPGGYAVGTAFFRGDSTDREAWQRDLERATAREGQTFLGWRDVPIDESHAGPMAREVMPTIRQFFIENREDSAEAFERKLYVIRRTVHRHIERFSGLGHFYVGNLSPFTVVYKGLLQGTQLRGFYPDLADSQFVSALSLVHSRFSTNTLGSWALAHPYRYLAHNGEINTLAGNLNWMHSRESQLESPLFGDDMAKLAPIIHPNISDSASFDNALEFLVLGGRTLPQAVMTMIPEAWESSTSLPSDRAAFYQYSSALMQPWDGPAAVAFTDGKLIGAALDRNGLRPARYAQTNDGLFVLASEAGALPLDPASLIAQGRLGPGEMLVLDLTDNSVSFNEEIKAKVVAEHPYAEWIREHAVNLRTVSPAREMPGDQDSTPLSLQQRIFGYTTEDLRVLLLPMAQHGKEADGSMGTDTALAVLSQRPRLLYDYFQQLFAQVTNPPIDPLRERSVMSLRMQIGREHNLLEDGPQHARRLVLPSPVLSRAEFATLREQSSDEAFRSATLSTCWPVDKGPSGLRAALRSLCDQTVRVVQNGASIVILSDRGVDNQHVAIPSLLAASAVYQHLIRCGLGGSARIVVESGDAREVHHVACLLAFGAAAVCPYVALATTEQFVTEKLLDDKSPAQAERSLVNALNKGLLKIISKMGISTVHSYWGSQLFEILGLSEDVVSAYFTGAPNRLGGADLEELARELLLRHRQAVEATHDLPDELFPGGEYAFRAQGPAHRWNEHTIPSLQRAVRSEDAASWEEFAAAADADGEDHMALRSLLHLRPCGASVPLDEVEPINDILRRFSTGAMSMGSISPEVHETLALAMNAMGGRSNSGEGGEDPARFAPYGDGVSKRSAIKQVASARFGVTIEYLANADVLQIKIAQGAKPGEGGQLPGHKVSEDIARLRHSTPGLGLISPPPHHDIYSIEDLAQLIIDLKLANPNARISVKLVSEIGVGTIAAGVVKAGADHVVISGFDGGTGAAPQSSLKHAGAPWELGLAEAQDVLVENGLRHRVCLQTDGQLRTGRDVVVAALLGADEYGFATAPLIALGCVMMRVCHLNTCPVGVATQDPVLRRRFTGLPEHVIRYFTYVAEDVRKLLAQLGLRSLDEAIGRVELLDRTPQTLTAKARNLDLDCLLRAPNAPLSARRHDATATPPPLGNELFDIRHLEWARNALTKNTNTTLETTITNVDRSIGVGISGLLASSNQTRQDHTLTLRLTGIAGQSLAAFGAKGLTVEVTGAANDYVGKGLSGAIVIVRPSKHLGCDPHNSVIAGNVALYGATSGKAFLAGQAGERFAVRNSGALAVVEGIGSHGCEYMTGGTVIVLGAVGHNFAAGMSGGIAYVYEPRDTLAAKANLEMIGLDPLDDEDRSVLFNRITEHASQTNSPFARGLLESWDEALDGFTKVIPHGVKQRRDERRNHAELAQLENNFASLEVH